MLNRHSLLLALPLTALSTSIYAQQVLENIVVTATKREQTLQEVPLAVSVTSGETLEQAQILDLLDLQTVVPTLRVTQLQTSTQTNFLIRGFGNGANNPGIESSVGVFVDGVYRSRSASQIGDLVDIERVEVLRGPQSTLFGQNASAGVINIVTRTPDDELGGMFDISVGDYNSRLLRGRISGPMGDTAGFSLTASLNERDGYYNELANGFELNDRDRWDVRGQLMFEPSDALSVRIIADASELDEACCGVVNLVNGPTGALVQAVGGSIYTGSPSDRNTYLDSLPVNLVKNDGISLHIDWQGENLGFQSITAVRNQQADFNYDTDFTSARLVPGNVNDQDIDTFTQEFRLTGGGDAVSWLFGAYLVDEDVSYSNDLYYGPAYRPYADGLVFAAAGDPTVLYQLEAAIGVPLGTFFGTGQGGLVNTLQQADASTIFGQVDIALGDSTTLTLGVSSTDNDKDVNLAFNGTDVFSSLNLVDIGFAGAFAALTGGLPPTPTNLFLNQVAAGTADYISVTPCTAATPPPACNSLLALYPLQFLSPVVPFSDRSDDSETTYTVRLAHDLRDNATIYGSVSTGFKPTSWNLSRDSRPFAPATPDRSPLGGFVNPYYGRYGTRYAGPEESRVVELGFKAQWDKAMVNIALFDQEIEGFQSNIFTGTGFSLANAGKQSTDGIEFDLLLQPSENWEISIAGIFMDPIYDSFVGAQGPAGPVDLSGTKPAGLHDESVSLGFTRYWQMGANQAYLRLDYLYEGNVQVVENIPAAIASREVGLLNASFGIQFGDWEVRYWGRNLTDDSYLLSAFPSVAQAGSFSGYMNTPRMVGVSLRRDF